MSDPTEVANAATVALLQRLWFHRRLLVIGTVLLAVAAVAVLLATRVYQSEGFYQVSNLSYADYKRYGTSFFVKERLSTVAANLGIAESDNLVRDAERVLNNPITRSRYLDPVFPFTKADAKELPEVLPEKNESYPLIGIRYSFENRSPERAQLGVRLVAASVRDSLISGRLRDYIDVNLNGATNALRTLENRMLAQRFEKDQLTAKLDALTTVMRKYPESARIDGRQVISVDKGGAEFLSPLVQIVGIESKLADVSTELARLAREREIAASRKDYYTAAKALLDKSPIGEKTLQGLEPLKESLFKARIQDDDRVRDVYNSISVDNENFRRIYFDDFRFLSGPTLPERPASPRLLLWIPLAMIGAAITMIVLVLGWHSIQLNWRTIRGT